MFTDESVEERDLRLKEIMKRLDERFGESPQIFLHHDTPWQLLFATILSAQCTDERVNKVTEVLFKKYPSLSSFAEADIDELMDDVRTTGFFRNKARNIKASAKILLEDYRGIVPDKLEELLKLPGVGRKTANLILGNIYGKDSIVVDTHVKRVSNRLGFADSKDPTKVEFQLMEVLPKDYWIRWNTHIISLGRSYCKAGKRDCEGCYLNDLCPSSLLPGREHYES